MAWPSSIKSTSGQVVVSPDEAGALDISVTPGVYSVAVETPLWLYAHVSPDQITLEDPRACSVIDVSVKYNGRIAGRVIDANGAAVPGLTVKAAKTSWLAQRELLLTAESALTDIDGRFEIAHLSSGESTVGTNLTQPKAPVDPRPRASARIDVTRGALSTLAELRLPADIVIAPFTGIVVDANGEPVDGATVLPRRRGGPHVRKRRRDDHGRERAVHARGSRRRRLSPLRRAGYLRDDAAGPTDARRRDDRQRSSGPRASIRTRSGSRSSALRRLDDRREHLAEEGVQRVAAADPADDDDEVVVPVDVDDVLAVADEA